MGSEYRESDGWIHSRMHDFDTVHRRIAPEKVTAHERYGAYNHLRRGEIKVREHRRKPETWIDANLAAAAPEKHTQRDSSEGTVVSRADLATLSGQRKYGRRAYDKV